MKVKENKKKIKEESLNKIKNNSIHGITLIALVVTIIILIILAGVSINLLLGDNGIITKAKQAKTETEQAKLNEEIAANELMEQWDDIVGETTPKKLVTEISLNKTSTTIRIGSTETLTATITPDDAINKNVTWSSNNESVATVANGEITGLAEGTATITAIAQDGSGKSASCTVNVSNKLSVLAKPGDYIKYEPTAKTFSMTPEQTGQDENQDFNTADYKELWQVLYNDSTYGLQIISAKSVGKLILGGDTIDKAKVAYNKGIDTLNSYCEKFVDTSYAKSGRSVGSLDVNVYGTENLTTDTIKFKWNNQDSGYIVSDSDFSSDCARMNSLRNFKIKCNLLVSFSPCVSK